MLQLVRRRHTAGSGILQTQSKAFADFKQAFADFGRKERQMNAALLCLTATNLFLFFGALSFALLMHRR